MTNNSRRAPQPNSRKAPQPVFVDSTGSRRRWFAILGVAGGALLALVCAMLIAGFVGGGGGYLPGLPIGPRPDPAVGQPGPLPGDPGSHPGDPGAHPGNGASATPAPGRTSLAPTPGGNASVPAGSAAPSPNNPASSGHRNTAHPTPTPSRKK